MKRYDAIGLFALVFGVPLFATVVGCFVPLLVDAPFISVLIMLLSWVAGFSLFLKAKISLIRRGKPVSFGARHMSQENRTCYILGYVLMGVGLCFSLGIMAAYR